MKRLTTLLLSVVSFFVLSATALATPANGWSVSISSPANTTNKSFNVQYTTLSTGQTDDVTVKLFQNGGLVSSQTTTKDFGDSGVFGVTVPGVGTYSYYIEATNSSDATPKITGTVNVVVSEAPQATTTTNTARTGSGVPTDTDGDGVIDDLNGDGVVDDADGDGVVDDQAAKTERDRKLAEAAAVLATKDNNANGIPDDEEKEDDNKEESSSSDVWWYVGGATALLLGGAYYFLGIRRAGK